MWTFVRAAVVFDMVWSQFKSLQIGGSTLRLLFGVWTFDAALCHRFNCFVPWRRCFPRGMWSSELALFIVSTPWRFAFRVSSCSEREALWEISTTWLTPRHWKNHWSRVSVWSDVQVLFKFYIFFLEFSDKNSEKKKTKCLSRDDKWS